MDLTRHTSRRLFEEHLAVIALLERFGQALARLIEAWIARVAQPSADWDHDPDPPRMSW